MHKITIVIATYNNANGLKKTMRSILDAANTSSKNIQTIITNNNSNEKETAAYKEIAEKYSKEFEVVYVEEKKQGRSYAMNTGIKRSTGDTICFIDDDEIIAKNWIQIILDFSHQNKYQYIGGPYLPDWEHPPPSWLPAHRGVYRGTLGWIEQSLADTSFENPGMELCGGNFAVKREVFSVTGLFDTTLGRSGKNLMGGEDGEFHTRLKKMGYKGLYTPSLTIYHHIPLKRMTRKYHLRWAYWSGVSNGIRISTKPETKEPTPHLLGIPRYWFRKMIYGLAIAGTEIILGKINNRPNGTIGAMDAAYSLGLFIGKNFKQ